MIRVQWTRTALEYLRGLPKKVQAGLLAKADELQLGGDPRKFHKPLTGPLGGHYRITYGRYRAIYRVDEERGAGGNVVVTVTVTFVACGTRREHSRDDVYRVAEKLIELGIIDSARPASGQGEPSARRGSGAKKKRRPKR